MDFKKKIKDNNNLSIIAIFLFSTLVTSLAIIKNTQLHSIGYNFHDTYLYLNYALRLSGVAIEGYEFMNFLSPLIPFLTSLIFRLGHVSEIIIFIITGVFYIVGSLGLYLLARLYFKNIMAIFTSMMCFSLSINLIWLATGTIDIASLSLSIWAIYLTYLAVKKNQRYFYLAFPVLVLAFFAKYTAILVLPVMAFIVLTEHFNDKSVKKYLKSIFKGVIAGILTFIPFITYLLVYEIPLGFVNQATEIATKSTAMPPENNIFYYFEELPFVIRGFGSDSYLNIGTVLEIFILGLLIVGLTIGLIKFIIFLKSSYKSRDILINKNMLKLTIQKSIIIMILTIVITGLLFLLVGELSFVFSELLFLLNITIFTILLNKLLKYYGKDANKINYILAMFLWFTLYLIFFSAHLVKGTRYFIVMTPAFAFFIALSIEFIDEGLKFIKNKFSLNSSILKNNVLGRFSPYITKNNLVCVLIAILVIFSASNASSFEYNSNTDVYYASDVIDAVTWLKNYDTDYYNKVIYSDRGEMLTWLLKKEVVAIGYNYLKVSDRIPKLEERMKENNVSYFIGRSGFKINGFDELKRFGNVSVYVRSL